MWKTELKKLLHSLKSNIDKILEDFSNKDLNHKSDGSPVTKVDLMISSKMNEYFEKQLPQHTFFCEENHGELCYPAVIIDPIDGTRGLLDGTLESSISIAIMEQSVINESDHGIIYNPFNGYYIDSQTVVKNLDSKPKNLLKGMVSRSEFKADLFEDYSDQGIFILPMGSIAYKLGLLAGGMIDFVITKRPKHIWDVAAGSVLCEQAGLKCYGPDLKELKEFPKKLTPPILWCRENEKENIVKILKLNE
jgi:myo-inositol-1(or 4)-monophosphatase